MNNIILIGMPEEGKLLSQIIEDNGDAGFIRIENDVNKSIEVDNTVIATGGSAVYGDEAMEHFKSIGTVIYLEVPYKEIEKRVGSLKDRGVVSNGKASIEDIYADRIALYEKYADVIIKDWDMPIRETIEKILGCKEIENRL